MLSLEHSDTIQDMSLTTVSDSDMCLNGDKITEVNVSLTIIMKLSFLEMFHFGQFVFGIRFSNLYIHIDFVYCFRQTHEGE